MFGLRRYIVILVVVLGGCQGTDNALWGSIDESFSLDFDRVSVQKQNLFLRIEYVNRRRGGADKVCKLVINTENLDLKDNSELRNAAFDDRLVTVERVTATGGDFPPESGGHIFFEHYDFNPEGSISGDFNVLFDNGRNLFGTFDGKVKVE